MIEDHLQHTSPIEEQHFFSVQSLSHRVQKLSEDCRIFKRESHHLLGDDGSSHEEGVRAMRQEIAGFKRILQHQSSYHTAKIAAVSKNVAEVKDAKKKTTMTDWRKISKHSDTIQNSVNTRGLLMNLILVLLLAAIVVIGVLMYNRISYYEKKHFQ